MCRRSPGSVFILFHFCTGGARRMSRKSAGKIDICFYHTAPLTEAAKKRLVKGVFNRGKCPGRRFGSAGLLDGMHRSPGRSCRSAENFIYELQGGAAAQGRWGRSQEAPARFTLIPALCKSHFFQVRYVPAGLLSRYGCKVYSRSYI